MRNLEHIEVKQLAQAHTASRNFFKVCWISPIYPPRSSLHLSLPFPLIQEVDLSGQQQVVVPQWSSTGEKIWSLGDIWWSLETFLIATASNGMLLNTLQKHPSPTFIQSYWPKMISIVPRREILCREESNARGFTSLASSALFSWLLP